MRDISYRAKRKDNGEWVYGVPLKEGYSQEVEMLWYEYGSLAYTERVQVLPETVGQYVGLTDKNGKKIFEGDIVKNEYEKGQYQYFKIVYDTRVYCWKVENKYGMLGFLYNVIGYLEVIGNIHDNPELLEVK